MLEHKIAVIGLGYVGLPLAVEIAQKYPTIGFDISQSRVNEINSGFDQNHDVDDNYLIKIIQQFNFFSTTDINDILKCNIYIITVPTPIDKFKRPDLTYLMDASEMVGKILKKGDIVIYESTVYPEATEEDCVPILEKSSGLKYNHEFYCGYSPERMNPGDKEHSLNKIIKVTSGSNPQIAKIVDDLYKSIIIAGTHLAPSIKIAEAAKVIENAQRDINIAFINELAIIFNKLNIDTNAVLAAAKTKWNFLPFKPGLVGGHCIGVDPYYLSHKAQEVGYIPEIILAGRKLNDNMGIYIANQVIKLIIKKGIKVAGSRVLILGITFKENCSDIRNSKVVDIKNELQEFGCNVDIYDPLANNDEVKSEFSFELLPLINSQIINSYNAIVIAVAHNEFSTLELKTSKNIVFDIRNIGFSSDEYLRS